MIILLIISTKDTDSLLLITLISLSVVILLLSNKKTNFLNKTEWRNFAISLVLLLVITLVYFFCVPEKHLVIDNAHVIKTKEKDGKTQLLAYINDDLSKSFLVRLDGKTKAVKDALINVSGNLDDRTDYDTKLGGSNIVPTIDAKKVIVVGHSEY